MKKMHKNGAIFDVLQSLAIGAAVFFIVIALTQLVLTETADQAAGIEGLDYSNTSQCEGSYTCNTTNEAVSGIADLPGWGKIAITVGVTVAVIGMVMALKQRM